MKFFPKILLRYYYYSLGSQRAKEILNEYFEVPPTQFEFWTINKEEEYKDGLLLTPEGFCQSQEDAENFCNVLNKAIWDLGNRKFTYSTCLENIWKYCAGQSPPPSDYNLWIETQNILMDQLPPDKI